MFLLTPCEGGIPAKNHTFIVSTRASQEANFLTWFGGGVGEKIF
jgi:hypothetical protein